MRELIAFVRARQDARELGLQELDWPARPSYLRTWIERDIAAKRAIVNAYELAVEMDDQRAYINGLAEAIREIAQIDEDQPNYDQNWRPLTHG